MEREEVAKLLTASIDPNMPVLNRKLPKARNGTGGRETNLTQGVWFDLVFELNEKNMILGNFSKVMSDRVILANWVKEYEGLGINTYTGQTIGGAISSGKITIGMYRNFYRKAKLYDFQPKPYLMSFRYCREAYPCKERTKAVTALTLDQCRELCLQYKIADPRFFSTQEIADITSHADKTGSRSQWGIPSKSQWKELNESVPGGIFGRTRIYNIPYDESWSPLTW
jgi:hypothetical protein